MINKYFGFLVSGIIYIILGMLIINWSLGIHKIIEQKYNCIPCSAFQKECPIGHDTKENQQCWDSQEWPWKISMVILFFGLMMVVIPFLELFHEYYLYFKESG